MRAPIAFALTALGVLLAASASAEPVVVPTLALSGDTSGKGKISAGVDFAVSRGEWDFFLSPSFSVANDGGTAAILTYTTKDGNVGPTQFSGSLSATFAKTPVGWLKYTTTQHEHQIEATRVCLADLGSLGPDDASTLTKKAWLSREALALARSKRPQDQQAREELMVKADAALHTRHPSCRIDRERAPLQCACSAPDPACVTDTAQGAVEAAILSTMPSCPESPSHGSLCDWFLHKAKTTEKPVDRLLLCPEGKSKLKLTKQLVEDTRALLYPQHLIALGVTYTGASYKYIDTTGTKLSEAERTRSAVAGHALYTFVQSKPRDRFTFELPVSFGFAWKESTSTAYLCTSKGTITDPDTHESKSVQDCSTKPLGAPTASYVLSGTALFGIAGVGESDIWRVAAGPTFNVDLASPSTTWQVGGQVPLILSLTKAAGYGQEYEGLVQIMPTVLAERVLVDDKTKAYQVGARASLSIALLGKRKMFGSSLYWP